MFQSNANRFIQSSVTFTRICVACQIKHEENFISIVDLLFQQHLTSKNKAKDGNCVQVPIRRRKLCIACRLMDANFIP